MPAFKRVASVLAAVAAGFFLYLGSMMVFLSYPGSGGGRIRLVGFAVSAGLALACLGAAAALRGVRAAARLGGVVLLSVAGLDAFLALTVACMLNSPEMLKIVQAAPAGGPSFSEVVGAPGAGLALTAGLAAAGFALLRVSRPPAS